ncbi:hypothetical protein C1H76_7032 [Elsinoe australis]|uniref:Uncharacterized protein n=1 Tax=Elsinoe australis TaxID=40998 RepID=A0A4U7AVZ0_9PEZI|nr:hypothetical protein C1H76_7032 [Elsinoe australis]
MAAGMQNDSIIIWDDASPPSSPFISEVGETSRAASKSMHNTAADPEIDAIFNDVQQTPVAPSKVIMEIDKENARPEDSTPSVASETPFKTPFEKPEPKTATKPTPASAREQMPPPSTTKRAPSPAMSTAKRPTSSKGFPTDETPSRPKPSRNNTTSSTVSETISEDTNIDDTCFSTFSAVPEMTLFAKLGQSPAKPLYQTHIENSSTNNTPRQKKRVSPSRSPSPTPRRPRNGTLSNTNNETTSLLIDFTQQMEPLPYSSSRSPHRAGLSPSRTESNLLSYINNQRSPARPRQSDFGTATGGKQSNLMNLLDFELPPPPTPRSAPSFSAREVEALKSGFASQISSVKAKLSGKEAEVESLKKALEDAERRVGEAEEVGRLERIKREEAEREKESWERRGEEVERVLGTVREEVLRMEGEREGLVSRVEEAERRAEDAERRVGEMIERVAGGEGVEGSVQDEVQRLVGLQLDQRIEQVSRELHSVYKKKHETKVATLKKSYEARGEKKVAELQVKLDEAVRLNEDLRTSRDETFSGELGAGKVKMEEKRAEIEKLRAETEEQVARVKGLEMEMQTVKKDHARILEELEMERVEKGELVAAVDEMLSLQATDSVPQGVVEDFRKSLSRPTGLRAPAPGMYSESKLSKPSGLARVGSGKSKMMSNIERMGGTRGVQ